MSSAQHVAIRNEPRPASRGAMAAMLGLLGAVGAGCEGSVGPEPLEPSVTIDVLYGASGVVAPGLQDTVVVLIRLARRTPIVNAPLQWAVSAGGGSVEPLDTTTNPVGQARAIWTMGAQPGTNALTVTVAASSHILTTVVSPPFTSRLVVAGREHSCAIGTDGLAYCWGSNRLMQLGTQSASRFTESRTPLLVSGDHRFTTLAAGSAHTCGLTTGDEVWCWGSNSNGQLGDGSFTSRDAPVRVATSVTFTTVVAGDLHTCGLSHDGRAYCWGDNLLGQVGVEANRIMAPIPILVRAVPELRLTTMAAGGGFSCALDLFRTAHCWGSNRVRELGQDVPMTCGLGRPPSHQRGVIDLAYPYPPTPCVDVPLPVPLPRTLQSISSGTFGSCAVANGGELWCWGYLMGFPELVPSARVRDSWIVGDNVCGLTDNGTVPCWSLLVTSRFAPTKPFGDALPLRNLTGAGSHHCGLTLGTPGVVYCWGTNTVGELGDGTRSSRSSPVPVVSPLPASPWDY
jgi:alpha-tubulin suppressor-like RCC1 family protein